MKLRFTTLRSIGILILLTLVSCAEVPPQITITGVFEEDTSVQVQIMRSDTDYQLIGKGFVQKKPIEQKVYIHVEAQYWHNIQNLIFFFECDKSSSILLRSIELDEIASLSEIDLYDKIFWKQNVTISLPEERQYVLLSNFTDGAFAINSGSFYLKWESFSQEILQIIFLLVSALLTTYYAIIKRFCLPYFIIPMLLYVATFPLKISWGNWMLGLFIALSAIYFIANSKRTTFIPKPFYIIISLYFISILGLFYSINTSAINKLETTIPLLIFPVLFSIIQLSKIQVNTILRFFTVNIFLYCTFILVNFLFLSSSLGVVDFINFNPKNISSSLYLYPSFTHPSFISVIISMSIPASVYLHFQNKNNSTTSWLLLFILISTVAINIYFSGARIGLIILLLLLIISFLFYLKVKVWLKYGMLIAIGMCAIIFYFTIPSLESKLNDVIRQNQRRTAIAGIKEKPLFGWGTGSMETLLHSEDIARKAGLEKPIAEFNHFHNQYLDMLVQFGVIGSLPFFALFAYLIYLAIKRKDFLLMAYLTIYLPFMFVESPFATAKGIQPMIFWLCFLLSTQKIRLEKTSNFPSTNKNKLSLEEDGKRT